MRTRKLLVTLVACYLCLAKFTNCQDEGFHELAEHAKLPGSNRVYGYRDKNSDAEFMDRLRGFELEDAKQNYPARVEEDARDSRKFGRSKENSIIHQNRRAIDAPGSSEGSSGKSAHQSTPSNLPKHSAKPTRHHKNFTLGEGICDTIDIRNNVDNFEYLKDCQVIEGKLQIVLISNTTDKDFENLTFPKLREITGYFVLYRVDGLKSLSNLFPNLEVIRGHDLIADYSFMIYEMQHLQEIGLPKLTKILRGGVRIQNNPSLCYVSTVNWIPITGPGANFFKDNKPKERNNGTEIDDCPGCTSCPGGNCWSAKHCQIQRSPCHKKCLGECSESTSDCYVCKNFRHNGGCIEKCPSHLFAYLSRRCITKEECLEINSRKRYSINEEPETWRAFQGVCSTHCPNLFEDYLDKDNVTTCRPCNGHCHKTGPGAIIRHIADAQIYRGTTIIKGALEFQLRNGNPNIIQELTEAFGMVEEITDYLKVTHSFPITNLGFFKNLHTIKGDKLDINNATLLVLDNPNLSDLFPNKINITKGRLFFHYNPKLCYDKIIDLGDKVGIKNITDVEVQPESNGEKVACNISDLHLKISELGSTYVNVKWDVYRPNFGQNLLSYLLHYVQTESDIMSFEGNACGNNTWQIIDVEAKESDDFTVRRELKGLKPYTRYAVYVKTLLARTKKFTTNENTTVTGQSTIKYFRTRSGVPSPPTNVIAFAPGYDALQVRWGRPEEPNGPIGYYIVSGFIRLDDEKLPLYRDYCKHRLVSETESEQSTEIIPITDLPAVTDITDVTKKTSNKDNKDCCHEGAATDAEIPKEFEIFCQENITISYLAHGRQNYCYYRKYDVAEPHSDGSSRDVSSPRESMKDLAPRDDKIETIDGTRTRIWNDTYYSFVFNVSMNRSSYSLTNLRHYSLYTISVVACGHKLKNGDEMCSIEQYTSARTRIRKYADNVRNVNVRVLNETIVKISWDVPSDPNGVIVAHTIEYTNLMVEDAKKRTECVPVNHLRQRRSNHYIENLSPGRYSVKVCSVSLAGNCAFSDAVIFSIGIKDDNTVVLVVFLTFGFLLVALVFSYVVYRNHRKKKQQERLIASVNPDYIETKYIRDSWEVPRENIELLEELGLGNFGMVYRGILEGTTQVAVKTIAENSGECEKNEFLNEASVMKNFSTFHIIRLLGVVSVGVQPYVIMELMENGDLKTYLRRIRDTHLVPDLSRIVRMACEIADGMAYLESKKFVHRDLAARNCMVTKDLVCKIGDFGMARDIYETDYYKIGKKGLLPIRWMAPENLSDGVFTSDSDVWSYGVVLYEILTLAEIPYQGFSNEEVINYVLRKGTVTIPRNCPEVIVKIMDKCFKWRPSDRPTFMELVAELEPFVSQDFCEMSFYHSEEGVEIRNLGLKKVHHHAAPIRFHWGNETARWVREFEDNVTLLDQTKAGTSRGRIFKNGFQHFGNIATMEDVPLDR